MKIILVTLTLCAILFNGCKKEEQSNECKSKGNILSLGLCPHRPKWG
jgi:hypothetical protein